MVDYFVRQRYTHGGVCIFVRQDVNSIPVKHITRLSTEKTCEMSCIYIPGLNLIVIVIYRSPGSDFALFWERFGEAMATVYQQYNSRIKIAIAGDFNVDISRPSAQTITLKNTMSSYGLRGTVWDYTRIQGNSRTILDNVFTNINDCSVRVLPGLGDHHDILFTTTVRKTTEPAHITKRLFTKRNYQEFERMLADEDWQCVYQEQDTERKYNGFLARYLLHFNQAFPIKKVPQRRRPTPSHKLVQIRETLHLIEETYNHLGGDDLKNTFTSYKKFYLEAAREERRSKNHTRILQSDNQQKTLWQVINQETGRHKSKTPDTPSSEDLNKFFCSIAETTVANIPPATVPYTNYLGAAPTAPRSFFLAPVTWQEIEDIIHKLKPKYSTDMNGLNTKVIKSTGQYISNPLQDIINTSFQQGLVPRLMKMARVIPVFKKGDSDNVENYRPIAILPVFSKIFESALTTRLARYLDKNNILSQHQFGFREGRNTVDAVLSVLDSVWEAMERGEECVAVLCDLSRAFDCMQHRILLQKLCHFGIRGSPLRLMASYMEDRVQCVTVDGVTSGVGGVSSGVAQGSLVGPLLFTIFMNDLPLNVPARTTLYADDTTLMVEGKTHTQLLDGQQKAMAAATDWFRANQLSLNEQKTSKIMFTCDRRGGGESSSARLLGIWLDTRLTWRAHIDSLESELSKAVYAISRIRAIIGREAAITAYHALFHSKMSYGVVLWGESAHAERILILQKRAIRTVLALTPRTHCRPLFIQLGILTVPAVYILQQLVRARGERSGHKTRGEVTSLHTRGRNQLEVPRHRLATTQAQHRHLQIFNQIPEESRRLPPAAFKRRMKKMLLESPLYSINEFMLQQ